jgi:ketosteroid isomerase-like protein
MSAAASASIESSVKDHISLILAGKALEAFEKYYAEDAVMQENDQPPRVGKATNRAFEQDFLSKVTAMRTYANDGYVVSGNRAFVVWRVDIDHAEWGTINTTQVAIQEWKDGRIVREKFVYW